MLQQDQGIGRVGAKALDERHDAVLEQVVAEIHDEGLVAQVLLGDQHRVGQAERRRLADVGHAQAKARAVADSGLHFGVGVADDDADLVDAGLVHRLETVEEDGLVGDRHELLGRGVGDRPQPGAGATTEDEPSHATPPVGRAGLDGFVVFELVVALGGDEVENVVFVDGLAHEDDARLAGGADPQGDAVAGSEDDVLPVTQHVGQRGVLDVARDFGRVDRQRVLVVYLKARLLVFVDVHQREV